MGYFVYIWSPKKVSFGAQKILVMFTGVHSGSPSPMLLFSFQGSVGLTGVYWGAAALSTHYDLLTMAH